MNRAQDSHYSVFVSFLRYGATHIAYFSVKDFVEKKAFIFISACSNAVYLYYYTN